MRRRRRHQWHPAVGGQCTEQRRRCTDRRSQQRPNFGNDLGNNLWDDLGNNLWDDLWDDLGNDFGNDFGNHHSGRGQPDTQHD